MKAGLAAGGGFKAGIFVHGSAWTRYGEDNRSCLLFIPLCFLSEGSVRVIRQPKFDQVGSLNYPYKITCPQVIRSARWLCGIGFMITDWTLANISAFVNNRFQIC